MHEFRGTSMAPRLPAVLTALATLLGGAAATGTTAADANTFVVGRGTSAAELRRPGVWIDSWSYATLNASPTRPQGVVLVWTEVTRAKIPHRWWWKTYTSFCAEGHCSRPVLALTSRRNGRRTSENTVTPWRVAVSPDPTRNRAVVKAGIRWGTRWSITSPTRRIAFGPTDNVWKAGNIGITHTPDGQDWISWNNDGRTKIRISKPRNGKKLQGPAIARGGTPRVRYIAGRWVLLWFSETDDEALASPAYITSAPTIAGLRTAPRTRLVASAATDLAFKLYGPDDGPLFAVWWSVNDERLGQPIRGVWIDSTGAISAQQALPDTRDAGAYSIPTPDGGLTLCPWNVTAPLGGAFQPQPNACNDAEVYPVRLK